MTFDDLLERLRDELRQRVSSGAVTERALALQVGLSQPYLHNVLKGKRTLSIGKADAVLRRLQLDVLRLLETEELHETSRRR